MTQDQWTTVADVVSAVCLLGGAFFALAAGVGALRFPDLLSRMHAATKPQVLGLVLVLVGLALMALVVFRPQGILGNKKELSFNV